MSFIKSSAEFVEKFTNTEIPSETDFMQLFEIIKAESIII
jgi:hypothetical protein